jgi:choline dehydrogenase
MISILLFVALLAIRVSSGSLPHLGKYATHVHPRTASNTSYNFIIAGGGIGGLTVADRLTEDPNGRYIICFPRKLCLFKL